MIPGRNGGWARRRVRTRQTQSAPTFLFADLAGYSALSEEHGDEAAATVATEFTRVMRGLSQKHGARQVKSMGDGVMIWSPDAARAIALAADAVDAVRSLPVRIGVHTGPAARRRSDWYGSTVNVAARLAEQAEPGEALISGATRAAARARPAHPLSACRELVLHGMKRPIVAWRLR